MSDGVRPVYAANKKDRNFGAFELLSSQPPDGAKAAISRFGSTSDLAMRFALERNALVPNKDVIIQLGDQTTRFAGLTAAACSESSRQVLTIVLFTPRGGVEDFFALFFLPIGGNDSFWCYCTTSACP